MMYQTLRQSFLPPKKRASAFSLLEMMVAMFVLVVLLGIIVAITNSVSQTVLWTSSKIDAFASARSAFDLLSRRLSSATLNTYWDYDDPLNPTVYRRKSDLHFLIQQNKENPGYGQELYFVSPEAFADSTAMRSTSGLLNACGFFVQYNNNDSFRPGVYKADRWRYRLMQGFEPTENLEIYKTASAIPWFADISNGNKIVNSAVTPLADNVIALVVWPRLSLQEDENGDALTKNFGYDSKYNATTVPQPRTAAQLPPTVQVSMISISEGAAIRLNMDAPGSGWKAPPSKMEDILKDRFDDVAQYADDLAAVSDALSLEKIEFEVFNMSVTLREAKWNEK